jgi:hypothetical protein
MDGMGCAPPVDWPSSGLGYEDTRSVNLTAFVTGIQCDSRKTWRLNFSGPWHESARA